MIKKIVGLFLLSTLLYGVDIVDDFNEPIDRVEALIEKENFTYGMNNCDTLYIKENVKYWEPIKKIKIKNGYYVYKPEYIYQAKDYNLLFIQLVKEDIALIKDGNDVLVIRDGESKPVILNLNNRRVK